MPSTINRISGQPLSNVDRLSGVSKNNIADVSGVVMPSSSGGAFTTDKLLIWYDAALESLGATTFTNRVDSSLSGAIVQTGHSAGRRGNAIVQSIDSTQAMYCDGVNDGFVKRAYFTPFAGTGGSHGTSTFGVAPQSMVSSPSTNSTDATGFTMEIWWRTNGSFINNGNLWSYYHNGGIRTRYNSSGVKWYYMNGSGVQSGGWGTYNTNTWYHDVTTLGAPNADGSSSNRHTLKLYVNGSLVKSLTNRTWSPSTWVRDLVLWGGSRISGSTLHEDFRGYYGIVRFYHKALSSTEVTANYNAEKSRYGY